MILSIIIPVYNERRTIEPILQKVRDVEIAMEKEIIIVDGASFDGTREILQEEQKKHSHIKTIFQDRRNGRGGALKEGIAAASGDMIIFQDADLELDPEDYPALIAPVLDGSARVVFGSRFLVEKPVMTPLQFFGNRVVTEAVNLLYGVKLTDVETCYQIFPREIFDNMNIRSNDFAFTVELTVKLLKAGCDIREIPIRYIPRGRSEGKKIRWADGVWSLYTIIKYRFMQ